MCWHRFGFDRVLNVERTPVCRLARLNRKIVFDNLLWRDPEPRETQFDPIVEMTTQFAFE